jgi:hypothetical protein
MSIEASKDIDLKILEERLGQILAQTGGIKQVSKIPARVQGNGINRGSGGNRNLPEGERYYYSVVEKYEFKEFLKLYLKEENPQHFNAEKNSKFIRIKGILDANYNTKKLSKIQKKIESISQEEFKKKKLNLLSELKSAFLELQSEQNAQIEESFKIHESIPSPETKFHDQESQEKPLNFWDNLGGLGDLFNPPIKSTPFSKSDGEKLKTQPFFWENLGGLINTTKTQKFKIEQEQTKNPLEIFEEAFNPLLKSALNLMGFNDDSSEIEPKKFFTEDDVPFLVSTSLKKGGQPKQEQPTEPPQPPQPQKVKNLPKKSETQYQQTIAFFNKMKDGERDNPLNSGHFVSRKGEYLNERKNFWNKHLKELGVEIEKDQTIAYFGITNRAEEYLLYLNRNIKKINTEIEKGEQSNNLEILLAFHKLEIEKVKLMFKDDPREMFSFPSHSQFNGPNKEFKWEIEGQEPSIVLSTRQAIGMARKTIESAGKFFKDSGGPQSMKDSPYQLGFVPDSYPDPYTFNAQQEGSRSYRQYSREEQQSIIKKIGSLPKECSITEIKFPGSITIDDFQNSKTDKKHGYNPNNVSFQEIIRSAAMGKKYEPYKQVYLPSFTNLEVPSSSPQIKKTELTDEQELMLKKFKSETFFIRDINENTSGEANFQNIEPRIKGIERAFGIKSETYKTKFKEDKKQISINDNLKYTQGKVYTDKGENAYAYLCFLERKMKSIRIVRSFLENDNGKESCIEKTKEVEAHLLLEVVKIKNGITSNQKINRSIYLESNSNKTYRMLEIRIQKAKRSMGSLLRFVSHKINHEIKDNTIGGLDRDIPGGVHHAPFARNTSRHSAVSDMKDKWKDHSLGQYGNITDLKIELKSLKDPLKTKLEEILKKSKESTHQKLERSTTNPIPSMRPDASRVSQLSSFKKLTLGSIL